MGPGEVGVIIAIADIRVMLIVMCNRLKRGDINYVHFSDYIWFANQIST